MKVLSRKAIQRMTRGTGIAGNGGGGGISAEQVSMMLNNVNGTFWGQSWTNGNEVSGSLSGVLDISTGSDGGALSGFHSLDLNTHGSSANVGGFINFHFNGSSANTSRIIEDANGRLHFYGDLYTTNKVRIGDCVMEYDSTNNALKLSKSDGTAVNMYATGGVSALGFSNGVSSLDIASLSVTTLLSAATISVGTIQSSNGVNYWSITASGAGYFNTKIQAPHFNFDGDHYIYRDGSNLKYYDNGTIKTITLTT